MNEEKLVSWLNELVKFRDNEYVQLCELNGFSEKDSEDYQKKTDEIRSEMDELKKSTSTSTEIKSIDDAISLIEKKIKDDDSIFNKNHKFIFSCLTELRDLKKSYQYLAADFQNYKNRYSREVENTKKNIQKEIILDTLETYDDIERLLESIKKTSKKSEVKSLESGFQMILQKFENQLKKRGCVKILTKVGDQFDVFLHEAISARDLPKDSKFKQDQIVEIYSSGWKLNGEVIRPTKVIVGK